MRQTQGTVRPWWAALLWLAALCTPPAGAHLMPAQQGTLNVVGNAVFVVLALPTSLVPQADADRDGRLSQAELNANATVAQERVTRGLRLTHAARTPEAENGELALVNLLAEPEPEATHFLALLKYQFRTEPTELEMETDLFGTQEAEQQLTLKMSRGDTTEAAVLRPGHATHRFFRGPLQVFADYITTGVEHIVGGADHLLFLATIVVAGAGFSYWLAVLTSFTVAHSITLALGLLGVVRVSPTVVEPLIAASIVLVAALNLANRHRPTPSTARQATVVFACGLLHGLGFASSLADMGLHGGYRAASLAGFNLGIELGQALCLAGMLALLRLARPWQRHRLGALLPLPVLTSAMALAVGGFWVIQRLP